MAKLFLESGDSFPISAAVQASIVKVFGTAGSVETVTLPGNPSGVDIDANVERIDFAGNAADYTYQIKGNIATVSIGGIVVATINAGNAPKLAFADGSATLTVTKLDEANLGGVDLTTTDATLAGTPTLDTTTISSVANGTATTINVAVANNGETSDASAADNAYVFEAGNYNYSIAGFGAGDKLDFPDGQAISVSNTSFTDGAVDLTWASAGQTVAVTLTGLPAATDSSLNNSSDFATVFSADTLA